jgi:hypothetical protein
LVVVKVLVQEGKWVAAGDQRGGRVLRPCIKGLICCRIWQKKIIRVAPERGEGDRREEKGRHSPSTSNSSCDARSTTDDRRRIPLILTKLHKRKEKGSREEISSYL